MSQEPDRPDLSALPPELRAYVEAQAAARAEAEARAQAEAASRRHVEAELADTKSYVERLEHLVGEYRRARFGPRSEKLHPDQLALALEDLETAVAETETAVVLHLIEFWSARKQRCSSIDRSKRGCTPRPRRLRRARSDPPRGGSRRRSRGAKAYAGPLTARPTQRWARAGVRFIGRRWVVVVSGGRCR